LRPSSFRFHGVEVRAASSFVRFPISSKTRGSSDSTPLARAKGYQYENHHENQRRSVDRGGVFDSGVCSPLAGFDVDVPRSPAVQLVRLLTNPKEAISEVDLFVHGSMIDVADMRLTPSSDRTYIFTDCI
jgi:hypothetical protein